MCLNYLFNISWGFNINLKIQRTLIIKAYQKQDNLTQYEGVTNNF